jgi:phenylalanine-4-hydroxylase
MKTSLINQAYNTYTDEDHFVWEELNRRQSALNRNNISKEYLYGLDKLQLRKSRIADISDLSNKLFGFTGWSLVPVLGLMPAKEFFSLIIDKKYPITISIRKVSELDFSEQPDIFHDIFGHLPLLMSQKFSNFLVAYSKIAINYVENEQAVELLARLYWYTYEMGLINEENEFKAYGGAIITSANEIENVHNLRIPKHSFDIDLIFRTPYNPFKLQKEYFVIKDFSNLFDSLSSLENRLIKHLNQVGFDQVS